MYKQRLALHYDKYYNYNDYDKYPCISIIEDYYYTTELIKELLKICMKLDLLRVEKLKFYNNVIKEQEHFLQEVKTTYNKNWMEKQQKIKSHTNHINAAKERRDLTLQNVNFTIQGGNNANIVHITQPYSGTTIYRSNIGTDKTRYEGTSVWESFTLPQIIHWYHSDKEKIE